MKRRALLDYILHLFISLHLLNSARLQRPAARPILQGYSSTSAKPERRTSQSSLVHSPCPANSRPSRRAVAHQSVHTAHWRALCTFTMSSHLTNPSAPYTRSRTNLFLSYRDSAIRPSAAVSPRFYEYDDASESRGLLDDLEAGVESRRGSLVPGGAARRQVEKLPPKWVDLADRVEEVIERVKPKSEYGPRRSGASALIELWFTRPFATQSLISTNYMRSISYRASKIVQQRSERLTPLPTKSLG